MDEQIKSAVRQILTDYLEVNNHRKTPERYAVLDAIYSIKGLFTMEELGSYLKKNSFQVCRATLYNSMRLFIELQLVKKFYLKNETVYEAVYLNKNQCYQLCTVCGKISKSSVPEVTQAIRKARLKRFKKETFSVFFYGICSTCQAKITRKKTSKAKEIKIKEKAKIYEARKG